MTSPADREASYLLDKLSTKKGTFKNWKDDRDEIELRLPLPAGTTKKDLTVSLKAKSLAVTRKDEPKTLLLVDPLFGSVRADEVVWYIDKGQPSHLVLTVEKAIADAWGSSFCAEGGTLEYWKASEDEAPVALPSSFIESALATKAEFEASLKLPDDQRAAAEAAAIAKRSGDGGLVDPMANIPKSALEEIIEAAKLSTNGDQQGESDLHAKLRDLPRDQLEQLGARLGVSAGGQ